MGWVLCAVYCTVCGGCCVLRAVLWAVLDVLSVEHCAGCAVFMCCVLYCVCMCVEGYLLYCVLCTISLCVWCLCVGAWCTVYFLHCVPHTVCGCWCVGV